MFDLPRETHCYFIEALSESPHLKTTLIGRFLKFVDQLRKSKKVCLKNLVNTIQYDVQSVTGRNLRKIMLLADRNTIDELNPFDATNIKFKEVPESEQWRIGMVHELTDIKFGNSELVGFSSEEVNDIVKLVCTT